METAKRYLKHEKETLQAVVEARIAPITMVNEAARQRHAEPEARRHAEAFSREALHWITVSSGSWV